MVPAHTAYMEQSGKSLFGAIAIWGVEGEEADSWLIMVREGRPSSLPVCGWEG